MTDVWIDPAELDAMATIISQQGQRAQDAFAGDLGPRDLALPAHLGWVRDEGAALAQEAAVITLAYLLNAVDISARAEAVRAEQATATQVAAPAEVQPDGFVLSGSPTVSAVATSGDQTGFTLSGNPQLHPQVGAVLAAAAGPGFTLNLIAAPDGQEITGTGFTPGLGAVPGGSSGSGVLPHDFVGDLTQDILGPKLAGQNETYDPATNTTTFDPDKFYENKAADEKAIEQSRQRG